MRAAESCPLPFRYIVPLVLTDFLHLFPHICASDLVYPQRQVTTFENWTAWNVYLLKLSFRQNLWKPRKNAAQVGLLVSVRSVRLPVLPWKKNNVSAVYRDCGLIGTNTSYRVNGVAAESLSVFSFINDPSHIFSRAASSCCPTVPKWCLKIILITVKEKWVHELTSRCLLFRSIKLRIT